MESTCNMMSLDVEYSFGKKLAPVSGDVDHVGVEKLAHALVHVADNLYDIGSPEEKLAELEAFSHIAQDYAPHIEGGEFKLASYEEDFDGLGAYRDEFEYEDSLYGARQRALVKMAAAYGVPAEQLDEMLKEAKADKVIGQGARLRDTVRAGLRRLFRKGTKPKYQF